MKNKSILFVCQYFYPEKVSSAVLPFELSSELAKYNYEIKALVGYPHEYTENRYVKKVENINGVFVKRLKYLSFKRSKVLGRLINYFSFCIAVLFHHKYFKNIDFCISYTNPPLLPPLIAWLSKKYKFKYIFEIYDLYPDTAINAHMISEKSKITKMFNFLTNYALKYAYIIIVLSQECKNYLLQTRQLDSKKIEIIPNWYKQQNIELKTYPKKTLKILYGGNMGIMQDMETIYNTIINLKNNSKFEFIFAGHGTKKEELINIIKENHITNCKIHDFLPKNEYDQLMDSVDFAFVSLEKFGVGLGSPSKLYGYLAKGIPVIAIIDSNTDIAKDINQYKNGILINNGDYDCLVNGLNYFYKNQNSILNMHYNTIKLFKEKYTLDMIAKRFKNILRDGYEKDGTI